MWKKSDNSNEVMPAANVSAAKASDSAAVIAQGIKIDGEFSGHQDLLVRGEISGSVDLPNNTVTVGQSGVVKATVKAATIIIQGRVEGNLHATDRIQVGASGEVTGNLYTGRLSLDDGARFRGNIDMASSGMQQRAEPVSGKGDAGEPAVK